MSEPTPIGDAAARFIAATPRRQHAPEVLDAAKMCLVDWLGVALGAAREPAALAVRRAAEKWRSQGSAHILLGPAMAPTAAALVNGTMAHCMDFDDTHADGAGHISAPTWAAALALAEHHGRSESDALAAFIAGFEISARLGAGGFGRKLQHLGFHPSSVFGRFSAAAAASVLIGLDETQVAHALGVAGTTAGGLNASFGTMSKPFHLGKAAIDGILAAQVAAEGFEAATNLLDADNALAATLVQDRSLRIEPTAFTDGLALLRNAYKPYACCKATHACVDAARELSAKVQADAIRRVVMGASPMTLRVAARPDPQTPLEGKFSVAFCTALGLSGYPAVDRDFSEARLRDPKLRALVAKSELAVQPNTDLAEGFVEVTLADGRTLRADVPLARGNPGNPMSWPSMEAKFTGLVEPVLGRDTKPLFEALRRFEAPGTLAQLIALVARA
ncbi:MAG: MmgE/PrpD family protein [Burkholderiales bacterium]|nr:MmgE/PrpD family protein [Burkholderiales bacterium]